MSGKVKATYDLVIIGGGIVGLSAARQIALRHPKLRICLLEKEKELAQHQSKRNSGVVHAGIYYKKGSMKTQMCIRGSKLVKQYCQHKGLPFKQCGKLIVASQEKELDALHKLYKNAQSNRIKDIELIKPKQIEDIQPGCTNAIEAIWSPNTAIVDWHQVSLAYAEDFKQCGGEIITNFSASFFHPASKNMIYIEEAKTEDFIQTKSVLTCAGIYSDYFCRRTGNNRHPMMVPFKGSYFVLSDRLAQTVETNIYPVPDPKFPFLGVHITPRIDNSVIIGPTAMLAASFERYTEDSDLKLSHMYTILTSGVLKLLMKKDSIRAGIMELLRHNSKKRFAQEVSQLLPGVTPNDLIQTNFCGIRAQAIENDGSLVDDFLFERGVQPQYKRVLHVRNCPSPAATSSLALSERIADVMDEQILN